MRKGLVLLIFVLVLFFPIFSVVANNSGSDYETDNSKNTSQNKKGENTSFKKKAEKAIAEVMNNYKNDPDKAIANLRLIKKKCAKRRCYECVDSVDYSINVIINYKITKMTEQRVEKESNGVYIDEFSENEDEVNEEILEKDDAESAKSKVEEEIDYKYFVGRFKNLKKIKGTQYSLDIPEDSCFKDEMGLTCIYYLVGLYNPKSLSVQESQEWNLKLKEKGVSREQIKKIKWVVMRISLSCIQGYGVGELLKEAYLDGQSNFLFEGSRVGFDAVLSNAPGMQTSLGKELIGVIDLICGKQ